MVTIELSQKSKTAICWIKKYTKYPRKRNNQKRYNYYEKNKKESQKNYKKKNNVRTSPIG